MLATSDTERSLRSLLPTGLVGTTGTVLGILLPYVRWDLVDISLILAMERANQWPWLGLSLAVTALHVLLPFAIAHVYEGEQKRFQNSMIAVPWVLSPIALLMGHLGNEALGEFSDRSLMPALALVALVQSWVVWRATGIAWKLVADEERPRFVRSSNAIANSDEPATYPRPVRPDPNTYDDPSTEVGWDTGTLVDGRPFLAECWAEDGITAVSFFFSTDGIREFGQDDLRALLLESCVLQPISPDARLWGKKIHDQADQLVWSVTAVIADEDEVYFEDNLALRPYPR